MRLIDKTWRALGLLALLLLCITGSAQEDGCDLYEVVYLDTADHSCPSYPYVLVFSEEFEDEELDPKLWEIVEGVPRDIPQELFENDYGPDNHYLGAGILNLCVEYNPGNRPYTVWENGQPITQYRFQEFMGAEIKSRFRFGQGVYLIRCRIPKQRGSFPAFWTFEGDGWHEIDVFEFTNKKTLGIFDLDKSTKTIEMTIHRDIDLDGNNSVCKTKHHDTNIDYSEDFHLIMVYWDDYGLWWYRDGFLLDHRPTYRSIVPFNGDPRTCEELQAMPQGSPLLKDVMVPQKPMHILATQGMQPHPHMPDDPDSVVPFCLEIDYIRYFQRLDCYEHVVIDSQDDLNIQTGVWSAIGGTTVTLDNVTIGAGQHLEIIGAEDVVIGPGVNVEMEYWEEDGTYFAPGTYDFRIDPFFCPQLLNGELEDEGYQLLEAQDRGEELHTPLSEETLKQLERDGLIPPNSEEPVNDLNELSVYPSYVIDQLNIDVPSDETRPFEITVLDASGRAVAHLVTTYGQNTLDLAQLSGGIYFVQAYDRTLDRIMVRRFVKE